MSDQERQDELERDQHPEDETPQARIHVARWSPWIWIIPAIALFFVGWLVVRYGFFGGADITISFVEARGLDRYSPVRYRGAKVGTVQRITIDEELQRVVVRVTMDSWFRYALRSGTRFWIVEPDLAGGGIGGILTGTFIAMEPGEGEREREYIGLEAPPIRRPPEAGKTVILESTEAVNVAPGAPVEFDGMRVGRVLGSEYDAQRGVRSVHVFVIDRFASHVRESTRFWSGGGLSLGLRGGGIEADFSIGALLSPPISFYTPAVLAGAPVPQGARFELHDSRASAIAASEGPHLTYLTYFPGSVSGLGAGTPVQMRGIQVGRVREVRLRYVAATADLETPVVLEIDPRRLEIPVPAGTTREELRARMDDIMQTLVQRGMRATLATSLIMPGASAVSLEMVAARGTGRLNLASDPPIIPAAQVADGLEGILGAAGRIATTIENLPLQRIAGQVEEAAVRLNQLTQDPRLDESLDRMQSAFIQIERAAETAGAQIEPIALSMRRAAETIEATAVAAGEQIEPLGASLQRAAASAEAAASAIEGVAGTAAEGIGPIIEALQNAAAAAESAAGRAEQLLGVAPRQNYDLAELIRELIRAAESVRALANYLTEHPDSLLRGRAP
jgi:paraquat-inducible protein B